VASWGARIFNPGSKEMKYKNVADFMNFVKARDPNQPEFLQAVQEVMESLWDFIRANPQYAEAGLLERLVEPERAFQFRNRSVQRRNAISSFGQSVNPEIPRFRANIQERADDTSDGWRQGWFGF
jgi:hypothetical protein